jgi:DNA polymerase-3 subunit delta'
VTSSQLPWPAASLDPARWEGVRRLLARCLELDDAGALPGALMVVGAAGLGREAVAVELAAALVCRKREAFPCSCPSCQRVRRGMHPDVEVIDVLPDRKEISIEQARAVVENVAQHPYEGRRRVYVLASCHTPPLTAEAASALLKTLEEPPGHATFILLAANPARVLPTIVSRVVELRVPAPHRAEVVSTVALAHGCTEEEAGELLAVAGEDAGLVLSGGNDLGQVLAAVRELISAALGGDGLAILRAASVLRQTAGGVSLAGTALLDLAAARGGDGAEEALEAAATLLLAEARRAALHLDAESATVGALARVAVAWAAQRAPGAG